MKLPDIAVVFLRRNCCSSHFPHYPWWSCACITVLRIGDIDGTDEAFVGCSRHYEQHSRVP